MPNYVPSSGPLNARIAIVGEAPGHFENQQRKPFCGPSGQRLDEWLKAVEINRSEVYITNTHKYQPKANKIQTVPRVELQQSINELLDELGQLDAPYVIVPTGNTALRAITSCTSILKWRGSILSACDRRGREIKVIPTIHPAATFRSPYLEKRCRQDWQRIAEEAQFPEVHLPQREHFINPTLEDVAAFHATAQQAEALSIDIETPRKVRVEYVRTTKKGKAIYKKFRDERHLAMVGFATNANFSFTIPTTLEYWHDEETLAIVWQYIKELCENDVPKILQNGMFDSFWLRTDKGIRINNYRWDCLAMHHALDPADDHDLAYMASVDSREPYWKDSGKDNDEDDDDPEAGTGNFSEYQTYNGKDCCVEYELADTYAQRLEANGLIRFYEDHYASLIDPLLAITMHGVAIDILTMNRRYAKLQAECITLQDTLTQLAGEPLFTKKSLSTKKVSKFLYETLKLPKQYSKVKWAGTQETAHKKVTVNEVALRRMAIQNKFNATATKAIGAILDHRRKYQLGTFLQNASCDTDNRMRCTYKFTTEFNRLASSKNPRGTGRNLQNIDREAIDVFVADEGCVMLECDLSQAEDRIVKTLAFNITGNKLLLERARSMPWENDEHKRAAVAVFHIALNTVSKEQRYLAKRCRHAFNYGIHGAHVSDELLKEGYIYTPEECQAMLDAIGAADPDIYEWQKGTRREIIMNRSLTNSWGRIFDFTYERLDDALFRRGYACIPQSEVGMLLNQYGLRPCYNYIKSNNLAARINMQVHDSLKISLPPDEALEVATMLKASLERPRYYGPTKLTILCEFKLGLNAAGSIEFKKFNAKEFEDAAYNLAREAKIPAVGN